MINFECDYAEGALPYVIEQLAATNMEQSLTYGEDTYSAAAREMIKSECGREDADVHFLVGGTQANLVVISSALRPYQGVVASEAGHINVHETGAIEAAGHKVLTLPQKNGKITAMQISEYVGAHYADVTREHIVQPGMVYISQPTEFGTLYTKKELEEIYAVCREYGLYLFVDGARLAYGLASPGNDVTLCDLAHLSDVFYIGGTKCGALFGEAVVITNSEIKRDFRYMIKQRGAMLAKGRLLGIQFKALFESGLYFKAANEAVALAGDIRRAFAERGCGFLVDSPTNQQFPIVSDEALQILGEKYMFAHWKRVDESHCAVRFCTSWATKSEDVRALISDINALESCV